MQKLCLGIALSLAMVNCAFAQPPSQTMESIQRSHLEGNLPSKGNFEPFLARDLQKYFRQRAGLVQVCYDFLRTGPTQSGVSYPKFYLWVRLSQEGKPVSQGAVRVAAIDRQYFEVTDYLSAAEMKADHRRVFDVFPKAVGDVILSRL